MMHQLNLIRASDPDEPFYEPDGSIRYEEDDSILRMEGMGTAYTMVA